MRGDSQYAAATHAQAQGIMAHFDAALNAAQEQGSAQYALSALTGLVADLSGLLQGMAFCAADLSSEQVDTMFPDIHKKTTQAAGFITKELISTGYTAGALGAKSYANGVIRAAHVSAE